MKSIYSIFVFVAALFWHPLNAQLSEGLLIHYSLNGNLNDVSGNNYNGTTLGSVSYVSDYTSNAESALFANGVDRYVDFPEDPALEVDFPLTLSARVNFNGISGTQIIATTDFATNVHSGAWLQVSTNGLITAAFGNGSPNGGFNSVSRRNKFGNFSLQTNTWYQVTAIFNGPNDIDIFIGCELLTGFYEGFATSIGYTDAPGSLCRKRANPNPTPPFYLNGAIDDFRYWDRALTEEEITILCNEEEVVDAPCNLFQYFLADLGADGNTTIYGLEFADEIAQLTPITTLDAEAHIAYNGETGLIYAFDKLNGAYRTVNPATGIQGLIQNLDLAVTEITGAATADNGDILIMSQSMNQIFRVDPNSGSVSVHDAYAPLLGGDLVFGAVQGFGGDLYNTYFATREGNGGVYGAVPSADGADILLVNAPALVTGMAVTENLELIFTERDSEFLTLYNIQSEMTSGLALMLNDQPFITSDGDLASGCTLPTNNSPTDAVLTEQPFELTAYPNPTSGNTIAFEFQLNLEDEVSIQITSTRGELMQNLSSGLLDPKTVHKLVADISSLPNGIYLYRLMGKTVTENGKFMVTR